MNPIFIRTDKNGTKIYHDYTCPRCAGMGESDNWKYTGKVCFACGGSGKRVRPLVIKEYTEEYAAKLEAKRVAKLMKYEEEHAEEIAERKAVAAEFNRKALERRFAEYGCDKNGIGYVLVGKTYPVKDQIKEAGGKWCFGVWTCPEQIEAKNVRAIRIDISKSFDDNDSETPYEVIMNAMEGGSK